MLLVFSYLIVPSVTAMLFSDRIGTRLAIGWSMGALSSLIGIYASYRFDAPTGAAVICTFGAVMLVAAFLRFAHAFWTPRRNPAGPVSRRGSRMGV